MLTCLSVPSPPPSAGEARPAVPAESGGPGRVDPRRRGHHAAAHRQGVWRRVGAGQPAAARAAQDQQRPLPVPHDRSARYQQARDGRAGRRACRADAAGVHLCCKGPGGVGRGVADVL
eukprot:85015-Chlamydomonas_euryale.AAC.1